VLLFVKFVRFVEKNASPGRSPMSQERGEMSKINVFTFPLRGK
jgi:hypothetical protein